MKLLIAAALAVFAAAPALAAEPAAAPPAPAAAPAPAAQTEAEPAKPLTIDSTIGELIDNPKTDAVLKREIPDLRKNEAFFKDSRNKTITELVGVFDGVDHGLLQNLGPAIEDAQKPAKAPAS